MAGPINIFLMIVVFIASGALLVAPGILGDMQTSSAAPAPLPRVPHKEYPGFFNFLEQCSKKIDKECGEKVYSAIYFGNVTVSYECCNNLVNEVGKSCYDGLLRFTLKARTFKDSNSQIMARATQIWSKCT